MTYKAQANTDTGKPAASGGGVHARAGQAIRGNLYRGTGGKFQAGPGAQLQDRLAKLRAAMPKGPIRTAGKKGKGKKGKGKAAKPKQTPEQRAAAKEQQRLQNRKDALGKLSSKPNAAAMSALDALAKGDMVDPDMAGAIADETGLAERHADGSITLSAAGKKLLSSLDKGDAAGAAEAIAGAGDKQAKQEERTQAKEKRQQAVAQRKADREKKKAGGGGKPKAAEQERAAARAQRTADQEKRKQQRAADRAGREKARATDAANKEKIKTAQKERQTDRGLRSLSRGGKVGDSQLLDMEDAGLIAFGKDNKPTLTDKGKKRLAGRVGTTKALEDATKMQIDPDIGQLITAQTTMERYANAHYLALASWADAQGYDGLKAWADEEAADELTHARAFIEFARARGGDVALQPLDAPPVSFGSYADALQATLTLEQSVTASLSRMAVTARGVGDETTALLAGEYLQKQVGAEKDLATYIQRVGRASGTTLDLLDGELFGD